MSLTPKLSNLKITKTSSANVLRPMLASKPGSIPLAKAYASQEQWPTFEIDQPIKVTRSLSWCFKGSCKHPRSNHQIIFVTPRLERTWSYLHKPKSKFVGRSLKVSYFQHGGHFRRATAVAGHPPVPALPLSHSGGCSGSDLVVAGATHLCL